MLICIALPRAASFLPALVMLGVLAAYFKMPERPSLNIDKKWIGLLLCVPALIALSSFWAIDPDMALSRAMKFIIVFFPGLVLFYLIRALTFSENALYAFYKGQYILLSAAALFIAFEYASGLMLTSFIREDLLDKDAPLFSLNRSNLVLCLFYFPALTGLMTLYKDSAKKKYLHIFILTLCVGLALLGTISQTAQLTFLFGGLVFLIYPLRKILFTKILIAFILILFLASPFLVKPLYTFIPEDRAMIPDLIMEASIPHRLEVWNFVATETLKSPWIGNGVEALRYLKSERWMVYPGSDSMLHPHNAVLQVWLEFGLTGALLACAIIGLLLMKIMHMEPLLYRRLSVAMFFSVFLALCVGYGLWQSWQLGLISFLPALIYLSSMPAHARNIRV